MSLLDIFGAQGSTALAPADAEHSVKYQHFRTLLNHNHDALHLMAELEQIYFSGRPFDIGAVKRHYARLFEHVLGLATALNELSGGHHAGLPAVCRSIDAAISAALKPRPVSPCSEMILPLEQVGADMLSLAGGKAINLAIMKNELGLPVPDGFIVTAGATARFLAASGCLEQAREELAAVAPEDLAGLEACSAAIRQRIIDATVPAEIASLIFAAYEELEAKTRSGIRIAVRSSAIGEDGSAATFAGQYATVLNVTRAGLLDAFKQVVASKYSPRAIAYRQMLGLEDEDTPMCVIGLEMVDAQASGVMYTIDPLSLDPDHVKISSLWGLGEQLVGGDAAADSFLVHKQSGAIGERQIAQKAARLIPLADGGTRLEDIGADQQGHASLTDATLRRLSAGGVAIENRYRMTQDIEWAIDADDRLYFLQARPLYLETKVHEQPIEDLAGLENLISAGVAASHGAACGEVFVARDEHNLAAIPDHAILVTRTASPSYAAVMGRIGGLVTDVGSITSHLASVAREFGIPAIVNAGNATAILGMGETVTLLAEARVGIYRGRVEQLEHRMRPGRKPIVNSPLHAKLRTLLDHVSPLNLTSVDDPAFSVAGCKTFHDVIRFCHEHSMREMFGIAAEAEGARASIKLVSHLPLVVYVIDLGGGLHASNKRRGGATPDDIASLPMKALWAGFTHPGVTWSGTVNFDAGSFMTIMASIATSELGPAPGGDSYALLSRDYMNFSAKFGYHFATVDALCGDEPNHNYVSVQFAGGAGNYFGRSLRIQFIGNVLEKFGFQVSLQGDLLEASFNRHDRQATREALDRLGRLLATSRLLDMTLSNQDSVDKFTAAFLAGDYDLLRPRGADQPQDFYTQLGHWQTRSAGGEKYLYQNGRAWQKPVSGAITGLIGKTIGSSYHEFLDTIGAYYYFPLAIAKHSAMGNGRIRVMVKPDSGNVDRAGGIVFGLRNAANYFVFRINALEDNAILFEFVNNKRYERKNSYHVIDAKTWYSLQVEVANAAVKCLVNDQLLIEFDAGRTVKGHVGLWTKADSVTWFGPLSVETANGARTFNY